MCLCVSVGVDVHMPEQSEGMVPSLYSCIFEVPTVSSQRYHRVRLGASLPMREGQWHEYGNMFIVELSCSDARGAAGVSWVGDGPVGCSGMEGHFQQHSCCASPYSRKPKEPRALSSKGCTAINSKLNQ